MAASDPWPMNIGINPYPTTTIGVGTWWPGSAAGTSTGWQCPGCGHCYSPATAACWHCPQQPVTSTGANTQPAGGALCDCEGDDDPDSPKTCTRLNCDC